MSRQGSTFPTETVNSKQRLKNVQGHMDSLGACLVSDCRAQV